MGLHGEVCDNGVAIGVWQVHRLEHPPGELSDYFLRVEMAGDLSPWRATLSHRIADGAAVLAEAVLAAYNDFGVDR